MMPSGIPARNRVGRPPVLATAQEVERLRSQGNSWRKIARRLRIGTATAMRLVRSIAADRPNIEKASPKTSEVRMES
jgi:DNA invertase Pin-like site-specific DNA recombinase